MAKGIRLDHPRAPKLVASAARCGADRSAAGMVASGGLMAPASGLAIPRLTDIPAEQHLWHGSQVAARVALTFLKAGVASADDWPGSAGNPFDFLKRSLDRWLDAHSAAEIAGQFQLSVALSTTLDRFDARAADDMAARKLFLILEPASAGYVVLGPTLRLLEAVHPRLPAAFVGMFLGSLNRWIRVFDYREALERVERLREWYESDTEDDSAIELPDVERSIPSSIRRRPLSLRSVEWMLPRIRNRVVKRMLRLVLELERASKRSARPLIDEDTSGMLADAGEPLPALLAVFEKRDAIEGQFDEASQTMLELTPEPNLIVPLDGTDETSLSRAFAVLEVCCATLARASRLIAAMPGNQTTERE
jgi:hypothetical protein